MKNILLATIAFFFVSNICLAQSYSRWSDHLSYNNTSDVDIWGDKVVVVGEYGVFIHDNADRSLRKYSKVNGLLGEKISSIKILKNTNAIVLGFETGDFDILYDDSRIEHIDNIKNSNVTGSKRINSIAEYGGRIYLGTPFGIVAYSMEKEEFGDTYFFGDNGSYIFVNEMTFVDKFIYAATNEGVYKADIENPFLVDYRQWEKQNTIPTNEYNSISSIGGKVIANNSQSGTVQYVLKDGSWSVQNRIGGVINLKSNDDFISYTTKSRIFVFDSELKKVREISKSTDVNFKASSSIAVGEDTWISTSNIGLVKASNDNLNTIVPIGPSKNNSFRIKSTNKKLFLLYGYYDVSYAPKGNLASYDILENGEWTIVDKSDFMNIRDLVNVSVDPKDEKHIYISSWGKGVIEMYDNELVEYWHNDNSTLQKLDYAPDPNYTSIRIGGSVFDKNGNLWFANGWSVEKPFVMRSANGDWYSFAVKNEIGTVDNGMSGIVIDDNGNKWIGTRDRGVWIYNEGESFDSSGDDKIMKFTMGENRGDLPSDRVNTIAIDKNNIAWIGTQTGLVIFNDIDDMFNLYSTNRLNAKPIIIEEGGVGKKLLGNQKVNKIVVDGSNKKWFATESAGIYYTSSDGQKTIYHFTIENSPLLSNNILDLDVDPETGVVYIVTSKGLVSFKGNATEGGDKFSKVFAYPNPVRPSYNGDIYIKGLTDRTNVKITDINGNLIFETTSEGGQAVWNGNSLSGYKASSGVYLVFAISKDGNEKAITKILIVN